MTAKTQESCPDCGTMLESKDGYTHCPECFRLFEIDGERDRCPNCLEPFVLVEEIPTCPTCGEQQQGEAVEGNCPRCEEDGWLEERGKEWINCSYCGHQYKKDTDLEAALVGLFRYGGCPHCNFTGLLHKDNANDGYLCSNCSQTIREIEILPIIDPLPIWENRDYTGCYICGEPCPKETSDALGRKDKTAVRCVICPQCEAGYAPTINHHKACECLLGAPDYKASMIPLGIGEHNSSWYCIKCHTTTWDTHIPCPKCTKDSYISPASALGGLYQCSECGNTWVQGSPSYRTRRLSLDDDTRTFTKYFVTGGNDIRDCVRRKFLVHEEI